MKTYYICATLIYVLIYAVFHFGFRKGDVEQLYRINDQLAFEVQPESENYNGVSVYGFKPTNKTIALLCGACERDDSSVWMTNAKYRHGDWVFTDFPQHEQARTDIVNLRTGETIIAEVPADFKYNDDLLKLAEYGTRGLVKSDENKLTREYVLTNFQQLSSYTSRRAYIHVLFFIAALFLAFPKLIFWIIEAAIQSADPLPPSNMYDSTK
jgi:hypothetical protein